MDCIVGNRYSEQKKSLWLRKNLTIMRYTFLLLMCTVLTANGAVHSSGLSLKVENQTVREILNQIEKQSAFYFTYNSNQIDTEREVSIDVKNRSVSEILNELFAGENVGYKINDKHIVLFVKEEQKNAYATPQQSKKQITGKVVDQHGEPIIGANVVEKGTTNGVVTDIDGNYTLSVDESATIQISYIGYITAELRVKNQTSFNVRLRERQPSTR